MPKEASECGLRERNEREDERKLEAADVGVEVEERLQFFPTSSLMASTEDDYVGAGRRFFWPFLRAFLCYLTGALYHLGTDRRGGAGDPQQAARIVDGKRISVYITMTYLGRMRAMKKERTSYAPQTAAEMPKAEA